MSLKEHSERTLRSSFCQVSELHASVSQETGLPTMLSMIFWALFGSVAFFFLYCEVRFRGKTKIEKAPNKAEIHAARRLVHLGSKSPSFDGKHDHSCEVAMTRRRGQALISWLEAEKRCETRLVSRYSNVVQSFWTWKRKSCLFLSKLHPCLVPSEKS